MKPLICIAEPEDTPAAKENRENFESETIIINGIQFTAMDGDDAEEFAKDHPLLNDPDRPLAYYARVDRSLFPKDTSIILPRWME